VIQYKFRFCRNTCPFSCEKDCTYLAYVLRLSLFFSRTREHDALKFLYFSVNLASAVGLLSTQFVHRRSMFPVSMNLPPTVVGDQIVAPQPPFEPQPAFPPIQNQWVNSNNSGYGSYQLPLQLSQYYNVFPDVPSTRTSWTFPNGCVTSNIVRYGR
jgi:hypothetical protein